MQIKNAITICSLLREYMNACSSAVIKVTATKQRKIVVRWSFSNRKLWYISFILLYTIWNNKKHFTCCLFTFNFRTWNSIFPLFRASSRTEDSNIWNQRHEDNKKLTTTNKNNLDISSLNVYAMRTKKISDVVAFTFSSGFSSSFPFAVIRRIHSTRNYHSFVQCAHENSTCMHQCGI